MQYPGFEESSHQQAPLYSALSASHEWLSDDGEWGDEEERVSRMAGAHNHSRAIYTGTDVSHELVYLINDAPPLHSLQPSDGEALYDSAASASVAEDIADISDAIAPVSLTTPVAVGHGTDGQSEDGEQPLDPALQPDIQPQNVQLPGSLAMTVNAEQAVSAAPESQEEMALSQQVSDAIDGDETRYEGMTSTASEESPNADSVLSDDAKGAHAKASDSSHSPLTEGVHHHDAVFGVSDIGAAPEGHITVASLPSPLIDELLIGAEPMLMASVDELAVLPQNGQTFTLAELVGEQGESSWNTYSDSAVSGIEMNVYTIPPVELDDMALLLAC